MYTILTRSQCNFCDSAKALLEGAGEEFRAINIQDPENKWVITLMRQSGLTTVPQIFTSGGGLVGGYTELKQRMVDTHGKSSS